MPMIIPQPKQREISLDRYVSVPAIYESDFPQESIAAFADYLDRVRSIAFEPAPKGRAPGFRLIRDPSLAHGAYRIVVSEPGTVTVTAQNGEGLRYALASLLLSVEGTEHLNRRSKSRLPEQSFLVFRTGTVADGPDERAPWRGLCVDVARKWHPIRWLYRAVDICWLYKLNRLQIHFADNEGFRLPLKQLPELADAPRCYTRAELAGLCGYAEQRGVTLIPEIDMPGHCERFCRRYPEIFGTARIMRLGETAFSTLEAILCEVAELFPDSPYLHIGGDEAKAGEWLSDPESLSYMQARGLDTPEQAYAHFVGRMCRAVLAMGRTPMVWEGFPAEYNCLIPKETVVCAWESYYQPAPALIEGGFRVINCSWKPLYVLANSGHIWGQEEVLSWDIYGWDHFWAKSAAYDRGIRVPPTDAVLGGQMCVWGDGLVAYPSCEAACRLESDWLRERLPAMAERVWNVSGKTDGKAFADAFRYTDGILERMWNPDYGTEGDGNG